MFSHIFSSQESSKFLSFLEGRRNLVLRVAAIGAVFFAVGYGLSQPLSEASSAVASAGRRTWQSLRGGKPAPAAIQASAAAAPEAAPEIPQERRGTDSTKIRVVSVRDAQPEQPSADPPQPVAQAAAVPEDAPPAEQPQVRAAAARGVDIPASLDTPFPGVSAAREVAAKLSPALMDALEPVMIPGSLSDKLLLQKIDPSYPERALRAGLRGPVVLQAWIGKDGRIQELKLIRGPLLLGAGFLAFDAVGNWQYRALPDERRSGWKAQTMVTVDFKLAVRNWPF